MWKMLCEVTVVHMRTTLWQREKIIQLYWTIQKKENWVVRGMEEARGAYGERDIQKIICGLHGHLLHFLNFIILLL